MQAQHAYQRVKVQRFTNILIKLADFNGKDIEFHNDDTTVIIEQLFGRGVF